MATLFTNNLYASNATAAIFRAWTTFVHNVFMLGACRIIDMSV
jgi:hypothetical protein